LMEYSAILTKYWTRLSRWKPGRSRTWRRGCRP
jgi:hypothetical protein